MSTANELREAFREGTAVVDQQLETFLDQSVELDASIRRLHPELARPVEFAEMQAAALNSLRATSDAVKLLRLHLAKINEVVQILLEGIDDGRE